MITLVVAVMVLVTTLFVVIPNAFGKLTTSDLINLNDEQRYTLDEIKNEVSSLYIDNNFTGISGMSNDEIAEDIFEHFLKLGYTYCYSMKEIGDSGLKICGDSDTDTTSQDKTVKAMYEQMAKSRSNPIAAFFQDVFN